MAKGLGMPKQSICRKKKGIKGSSDEQNAVIIAAAIVELAGDLGIMSKFDRRATMEQAGIVPKQIMNARISILRHWKARVTMGWAAMPPRKNANDKREDAIVQALEHTFDMLGNHHIKKIMNVFCMKLNHELLSSKKAPVRHSQLTLKSVC